MSKLLTQEKIKEISQQDWVNPGANRALDKLLDHIAALTEENQYTADLATKYLHRAEKAEAELKRRDVLAGEPVAWIIERLYEPGERYQRRSIVDAKIYDVNSEGFWVTGEKEKHLITPLYAAPVAPAVGINANHSDPDLSPGEYSVNISTKGGAAIINGIPPAPAAPDEIVQWQYHEWETDNSWSAISGTLKYQKGDFAIVEIDGKPTVLNGVKIRAAMLANRPVIRCKGEGCTSDGVSPHSLKCELEHDKQYWPQGEDRCNDCKSNGFTRCPHQLANKEKKNG